MKPLQVVVRKDDSGLSPVGQSQIESPQFFVQPGISRQLVIGIVWPVLVHHIADERIVGGRLDAAIGCRNPDSDGCDLTRRASGSYS